MVSLITTSTLVARYESLREELWTLDDEFIRAVGPKILSIALAADVTQLGLSPEVLSLMERIDAIDGELLHLESLLPDDYEYVRASLSASSACSH